MFNTTEYKPDIFSVDYVNKMVTVYSKDFNALIFMLNNRENALNLKE